MNDRQEKFCREYAACGNATTAAEKAGYSPKTARTIGSRLLTNVDICKRIQELGKAGEKAAMLTIADKRRRLLEIVNNPDEKTDNILKAIDLDNKMEGVYTNKTELSGGIEYVLNWGDGPNCE